MVTDELLPAPATHRLSAPALVGFQQFPLRRRRGSWQRLWIRQWRPRIRARKLNGYRALTTTTCIFTCTFFQSGQ